MTETLKTKFNITDGNVSLFTSSLAVCEGKEVEIDESAYPFLSTVLEQIRIVRSEPTGTPFLCSCLPVTLNVILSAPTVDAPPPLAIQEPTAQKSKGKARQTIKDEVVMNTPPLTDDTDLEDDLETIVPATSRLKKPKAASGTLSTKGSSGGSSKSVAVSKKGSKADLKETKPDRHLSSALGRTKQEYAQPEPKQKEQKFRGQCTTGVRCMVLNDASSCPTTETGGGKACHRSPCCYTARIATDGRGEVQNPDCRRV